jgi:hypothetical protein
MRIWRRGATAAAAGFLVVAGFSAGQARAQQSAGAEADSQNAAALADVATALTDVAAARACATIGDDEDRLGCYDRTLRRTTTAAASSSPESAEPRAGAVASATRPAEAARGSTDEVPQVQIRAPAAAAATRAPATGSPGGGAAASEERLVTVVEVRSGAPNAALFVMDDGSIWRQTDSRRFMPLDVPFAAQIRPGALGSFFLVPTERGRAVRVRQQ